MYKIFRSKNGPSIINAITIIAIIGILGVAAIPPLFNYISQAERAVDESNLRTLNEVTEIYRILYANKESYLHESRDSVKLMDALVASGLLSEPIKPVTAGRSFIWDSNKTRWVCI